MIKKLIKSKKRKAEPSIAVLVEEGATAGYLIQHLKDTFNEQAVKVINSKDILDNNVLRNTDVLFIPGVQRASDAYRNNLGVEGGNRIKNWVKKGGTVVGLCQGAYLLTEKFQYADKYSGVTRFIHSAVGIFEGVAHGPVPEYTNRQETENPFIDHNVAKLEFNDAARGAACYAHGPWLELSDKAEKSEYQILARFSEVAGKPIAMATRAYGKGKAVFCSVVPEISGKVMEDIDPRLLPENTPNQRHWKTGVEFAQKLAAHEEERKLVWQKLINEIR